MKQKIVIRVSMNDEKSRCKALRTVVGVPGLEKAALTGKEKDQVEVIGDGIDAVHLTRLLRKNVAYAELISVGEDKKEEKNEAPVPPPPVVWPYPPYYYSPSYPIYEVSYPSYAW